MWTVKSDASAEWVGQPWEPLVGGAGCPARPAQHSVTARILAGAMRRGATGTGFEAFCVHSTRVQSPAVRPSQKLQKLLRTGRLTCRASRGLAVLEFRLHCLQVRRPARRCRSRSLRLGGATRIPRRCDGGQMVSWEMRGKLHQGTGFIGGSGVDDPEETAWLPQH